MFDERSFSDAAFHRGSWLMDLLARVRREVVRLRSRIATLLRLPSPL